MEAVIKSTKITISLIISLFILSTISIFIGVIDLNIKDIFSQNYESLQLLFISRLPRLLAAIITGVGMSTAGLIMQQLAMNKFVSPTTGATIQSTQLGVLIAIIFIPAATIYQKMIFAFITAILGTYVFVFFMQKIKYKDVIMIPLVGIMFGNIISGITTYFAYRYNLLQALSSWLIGDFSLIIRGRYEIMYIVLPLIVIAFIFANHFNIVGMGENFSKNLGVNYNLVLFSGLTITSLITAGIVVTVGTIPYLGLIIPNIVSIYKGDKLKKNIIDVALFGADFVLACDILGRIVNFPYEIPINLMVGVIGSAVFVVLLIYKLKPKKIKSVVSKYECKTGLN